MKNNARDKCHCAIHTAALSAGAFGAIPLPYADMLPITAVQVTMIIALAIIFKVNITREAAEEAARAYMVGNIGKLVAGGLTKLIPFVGSGANATVAASLTEILGWEVAEKFAAQTAAEY